MGGRSPLSSCGRRSSPPVAGFANRSFYNITMGDLPTPVFQQAPILPIFDVQSVHRSNPTFAVANQRARSAGSPVVNAVPGSDSIRIQYLNRFEPSTVHFMSHKVHPIQTENIKMIN